MKLPGRPACHFPGPFRSAPAEVPAEVPGAEARGLGAAPGGPGPGPPRAGACLRGAAGGLGRRRPGRGAPFGGGCFGCCRVLPGVAGCCRVLPGVGRLVRRGCNSWLVAGVGGLEGWRGGNSTSFSWDLRNAGSQRVVPEDAGVRHPARRG